MKYPFNLGPVAKALNGTVINVLTALLVLLPGGLSPAEILELLGVAVASSQAIFWVANGGKLGPYAKQIATAVTAALAVVSAAYLAGGGLSQEVLVSAILAVLNTFVVVPHTPNAEESDNLVVHDITEADDESEGLAAADPEDAAEAASVELDPGEIEDDSLAEPEVQPEG